MRSRLDILKEYKPDEHKALEVLLDIRDLLTAQSKRLPKRKYTRKVSKTEAS